MIRLHYSNRLENLFAPLAKLVDSQQRASVLVPPRIIVPNRAYEQLLRFRLSEIMGVAANLEFPFLRDTVARAIEAAEPEVAILDDGSLTELLFECLRSSLKSERELDHVRTYVEGGSGRPADVEVRTFQLAAKVSRLFREYSITRATMLHEWGARNLFAQPPFESAERWQRHLWLALFEPNGSVRKRWVPREQRRLMLLPYGFEAASDDALRDRLPPILHIFGLAHVGPGFVRMFARLSRLLDLHIYALNPCMEFWEDVGTLSGIDRASWIRQHQRLPEAFEEAADPFGLDAPGDTPALRLWSRPGREYIRLLNELSDCDFDAHFSTPAVPGESTLLRRLRDDILIRAPENAQDAPRAASDDGSIRFLACPGVRRESEIIANTIWSLVQQEKTLRFHQIAVILPDHLLDRYLPHIESVFAKLHDIPLNLVNRRLTSPSRLPDAVRLLLRLPIGRFTRDEVLHLLMHPAANEDDPDVDRDLWPRWCEMLGVYFGADSEDLGGTYIPKGLFNWDQALKRLSLGVFMTAERHGDAAFFAAPDGAAYLPHEMDRDQIASAACLIRKTRRLLSDAIELRSARLTFAEWGSWLSDFVQTHLTSAGDSDTRLMAAYVGALASLSSIDFSSEPVSYETAWECAMTRVAALESNRQMFAETGVSVGSLSALRSIPFRVIFIAGLNEADFPDRHNYDPLDLTSAKRRAGDVTAPERDRYLFLESLLAARDRLIISYVARDAQTGDPLEPSTLVRELQHVLRSYLDNNSLASLTIEHPLNRYDLRYFPEFRGVKEGRRELANFDPDARRGAQVRALREDLLRHCGGVVREDATLFERMRPEVREKVSLLLRTVQVSSAAPPSSDAQVLRLPLASLRRYLECPLQGAAQYAMGMLNEDDYLDDDRQDEPVSQSILERTVNLREVFRQSRDDALQAQVEYERSLALAQARGAAPAGPFADAAKQADLQRLARWREQIKAAHIEEFKTWQTVRIGPADEFSRTDRVIPELSLAANLVQSGGEHSRRPVSIFGNLGLISLQSDATIQCILRQHSRPRDLLGPVLAAIALAASGEQVANPFKIIILANGDAPETRQFILPTREQATGYLEDLASDLLSGSNSYFLPIDAIKPLLAKMDAGDGDLPSTIVSLRDTDAPCHCDYGPIRNARDFEPPCSEGIRRLVARRFGLIRMIFDEAL